MGEKENTSFFGHLLILRGHLLRMLLYVAIGAIVAFVCDEVVYDYIIFAPRSENFITYRFFCYLSDVINGMVYRWIYAGSLQNLSCKTER